MFFSTRLVLLFGLSFTLVSGCEDEHRHGGHGHSRRLQPSATLVPPTRPLQWGDLNFIHTTDTHGWLLGHQKKSFPEPYYRYAQLMSLDFVRPLCPMSNANCLPHTVVISESLPPLYRI